MNFSEVVQDAMQDHLKSLEKNIPKISSHWSKDDFSKFLEILETPIRYIN